MRDKIHYKFQYRASVLAIASCLSLSPLLAEAAGMGKITVFSGLGQPLRAEVDVSGTNEELATMAARLAPSESFDQAGIYYGSALKDLRFSLEKKGPGQATIKISSARPINDPFLDFLIELNWASGRLVREYTFLLDPLEVASKTTNRPVAVVDAKPVAQLSGGSDRPADPRPGAAATPSPVPVAVVAPPTPAAKPVEIPASKPLTRVPTEPAPLPSATPKLDAPKPLARVDEPTPIAKVTPKADTRIPTEPIAPLAAQTPAPTPIPLPAPSSQGETQLWPPMPGKRLSSLSGGSAPMSTPTPTSTSTFLPPLASPAPISRPEPVASSLSADSRSEVRLWPPEDKKRDAKASTAPAPINNTPLPPLAAKAPEPVVAPTTKPAGGSSGTHEVQRGETLRRIAEDTRPEGVSLEQMLVGLYRNNSDAFIGNNINRLRTGAVLTVPDKDAAASIPQDEASRIYRAQVAQWNTYRQKLAGAATDNNKDNAGSQASGGSVTAKVEEKAAPEPAKDQVKVSRTEGAGKGGKDSARAAALEEELLTKNKAIKEGQERIAALEKNVSELQKLVEMKNQSLADLQKQQAAKAAEPAPKPAEAPKPPEPVKPTEPPKAEEPKPAEPPKTEEPPKPAEPAPAPVEAPKPPPPAPKPPPPPEPEPEEESFLDGIIASVAEDPIPLAAGGGVLALLLGFMAYRRRRQANENAGFTEAPSSYQPSTLGPNSVYHSTGGQSINTSQTPPPLTDFSQAGPGTIDTDEVDPVAEADVYMAYGRDAQAEEILVEALQKDPQRTAVHLKLLEIYSNRRDVKQFETVASELYAQTGGKGPDWEKAAALGRALDPNNPLFGGRQASPQPQPVTPPPPPPPVFEAPRAPAAPQAPAATATNVGLDFDLGASSLAPAQVPAPPPPPPPAPAPVAPPPPQSVAPKAAPKPDFATTTLTGAVSLRFTQPTSTPPAQAAATAENSFTPEGTLIQSREAAKSELGMNDLDFDLGSNSSLGFTESATATEASEAFDFDIKLTESALRGQELPTNSFDMSSINLDLDTPAISDAATEHGPQWEEVNTKLDLAKAYEEMGDMEGARELLQEVLNEGEADQIAQAKSIMDRLTG